MNRKFERGQGTKVPDGTMVFPFLNPKDSTSNLRWDLLEGMSIAAGDIPAKTSTHIHVHLHVKHVTFVLEGILEVVMKDSKSARPYEIGDLEEEQADLAEPGTFQQLINPTSANCRVVYLVSPAYVFEWDSIAKEPKYDDAIVFKEKTWEQLAALKCNPPELRDPKNSKKAREACYLRLARRKARIR